MPIDTTCILCTISLDNELQYHCLNEHINSGDDVATSCKKLVNFW